MTLPTSNISVDESLPEAAIPSTAKEEEMEEDDEDEEYEDANDDDDDDDDHGEEEEDDGKPAARPSQKRNAPPQEEDDDVDQDSDNDDQDDGSDSEDDDEDDKDDDDDDDDVDGGDDDEKEGDESDDNDNDNEEDDKHGMSDYERLRAERIRRNQRYLAQLGLEDSMPRKPVKRKKKNPSSSSSHHHLPRRDSLTRASKQRTQNYADAVPLKEFMGPTREKLTKEKEDIAKRGRGRPRKASSKLQKRVPLVLYKEFKRISKRRRLQLQQLERWQRRIEKQVVYWQTKAEQKYQKKEGKKQKYLRKEERLAQERLQLNGKTQLECWEEFQSRKSELWEQVVQYQTAEQERLKQQRLQERQAQQEAQQIEFRRRLQDIDAVQELPGQYQAVSQALCEALLQRAPPDPPAPRRSRRTQEDEPQDADDKELAELLENPKPKTRLLAPSKASQRIQQVWKKKYSTDSNNIIHQQANRNPKAPPPVGGWISPHLSSRLDRKWLEQETKMETFVPQAGDIVMYYSAAHRAFLQQHPDVLGTKQGRRPLWEKISWKEMASKDPDESITEIKTTNSQGNCDALPLEEANEEEPTAVTVNENATANEMDDGPMDVDDTMEHQEEVNADDVPKSRFIVRREAQCEHAEDLDTSKATLQKNEIETDGDENDDKEENEPQHRSSNRRGRVPERFRNKEENRESTTVNGEPGEDGAKVDKPTKGRGREQEPASTDQKDESVESTRADAEKRNRPLSEAEKEDAALRRRFLSRSSRFQGTFKEHTESVRDLFKDAEVTARLGTKPKRPEEKKKNKAENDGKQRQRSLSMNSKESSKKREKDKKIRSKSAAPRSEPTEKSMEEMLAEMEEDEDIVEVDPMETFDATAAQEDEGGSDEENSSDEVVWWTQEWLDQLDSDLGKYPILCRVEQTHAEFPYDPKIQRKKVDKHGNITLIVPEEVQTKVKKATPNEKVRLCLKLRPLTPALPPDWDQENGIKSSRLPLPPKFSVSTFPSDVAEPFLVPFSLGYCKYHALSLGDEVVSADRRLKGKITDLRSVGDSHGSFRLECNLHAIQSLMERMGSGEDCVVEEALGLHDSAPWLSVQEISVLVDFLNFFVQDSRSRGSAGDNSEEIENASKHATLTLMDLIRSTLPLYDGVGLSPDANHRKVSYISGWDVSPLTKKTTSLYEMVASLWKHRLPQHTPQRMDEALRTKIRFTIKQFLSNRPEASAFTEVITEEDAPNYYSAVPVVMHFDRILARLKTSSESSTSYYTSPESILCDLQSITDNCKSYNSPDSSLITLCSNIIPVLKKQIASVCEQHSNNTTNIPSISSTTLNGNQVRSYEGPLKRDWLQIRDKDSWGDATAVDLDTFTWIPQCGDYVIYSPNRHSKFVTEYHSLLGEESGELPDIEQHLPAGKSWAHAKIASLEVLFPQNLETNDELEPSLVLAIGLIFSYTWSISPSVVYWVPHGNSFLLPAWTPKMSQDAILPCPSSALAPQGLDYSAAKSMLKCFDILKRRCLRKERADHADPKFSMEHAETGTLATGGNVGAKNLPTFEELLNPVESEITQDKSMNTRGQRKAPEDDLSLKLLSEAHFLPVWATLTSEDVSKGRSHFSKYKSQLPIPNLCLELVRQRVKSGYYRQREAVVNDLKEAFVSSAIFALSNLAIRKKKRVSVFKIALLGRRLAAGSSLLENLDIEQQAGNLSISLTDEEKVLVTMLNKARGLYAMAILAVTTTSYVERFLGVTSKHFPRQGYEEQKSECGRSDDTKKEASRRIRYFLAATGNDPCENDIKEDVSVKVRISVGEDRIKLKHKATNKILSGVSFRTEDFSKNDTLASVLLRREGRRAPCARCQVKGHTFYFCRVSKSHSNPDFDFITNWKEYGGVGGLLAPFQSETKQDIDKNATRVNFRQGEVKDPVNGGANQNNSGKQNGIGMDSMSAEKEVAVDAPNKTNDGNYDELEQAEEAAHRARREHHLENLALARKAKDTINRLCEHAKLLASQPPQLSKEFIERVFPVDPSDGRYTWCTICGLSGDVLCCDGCSNVVHTECVGLDLIPEGDWFCEECTRKQNAEDHEGEVEGNTGPNAMVINDDDMEMQIEEVEAVIRELDEKRYKSKGKQIEIGSAFYKFFPESGFIKGIVTALPSDGSDFYDVEYMDGDTAEMEEHELLVLIQEHKARKGAKPSRRDRLRKRSMVDDSQDAKLSSKKSRRSSPQSPAIRNPNSLKGSSARSGAERKANSVTETNRGWTTEENDLFFDGIEKYGPQKKRDDTWYEIANTIPTKTPKQVFDQLYWFFTGRRARAYEDYLVRKGKSRSSAPRTPSPKKKRSQSEPPRRAKDTDTPKSKKRWTDEENDVFFGGIENFGVKPYRDDSWDRLLESIPTRSQNQILNQLYAYFRGGREKVRKEYLERKKNGTVATAIPSEDESASCDEEWSTKELDLLFDSIERFGATGKKSPSWGEIATVISSRSKKEVFGQIKAYFNGDLDEQFASFCRRKGFLSVPSLALDTISESSFSAPDPPKRRGAGHVQPVISPRRKAQCDSVPKTIDTSQLEKTPVTENKQRSRVRSRSEDLSSRVRSAARSATSPKRGNSAERPRDDRLSSRLSISLASTGNAKRWTGEENDLFFDGILKFNAGKKRDESWFEIARTITTKTEKQVCDQLYWHFHGRREKAYKEYLQRKSQAEQVQTGKESAKPPSEQSTGTKREMPSAMTGNDKEDDDKHEDLASIEVKKRAAPRRRQSIRRASSTDSDAEKTDNATNEEASGLPSRQTRTRSRPMTTVSESNHTRSKRRRASTSQALVAEMEQPESKRARRSRRSM